MVAAAVLAIASAIVFYIMVGYPLILARGRKHWAPPVRKDLEYRPTVSILLAVHNGEDFIRRKLESLLSLDYPESKREILVISDGSTDRTDSIVREFSDRGIRLLTIPRGGKARALNNGIANSSGDILFFTDVRQALDAKSLKHLVANFADSSVGVVTGELRFFRSSRSGQDADLQLYWRYEVWARQQHSRIDSMFGATGCIYAVRRDLAEPIQPDTLADDVLIPARVFLLGYRVVLDPAALAYDYPTVDGGEFRRKLRTLAGLWQVHARTPELFTAANRMRFHFLSHKSSRLALPWAILLVWVATVALPDSPFRTLLLIDELTLIGLALIDRFVPRRIALKRITSPLNTFLAINAAALLSVIVFVAPPGSLWGRTRVQEPR